MPFFITHETRSKPGSEFVGRIVGVDRDPHSTYEEAFAAGRSRYPDQEVTIVEAETPREALAKASGVKFPPLPGE